MKNLRTFIFSSLLFLNLSAFSQWVNVEWDADYSIDMKDFVDDYVGYAYMFENQGFMSKLRKTADGGQTWVDITIPLPNAEFQDVDFYADGAGVIVLRNWEVSEAITRIYHTSNDGESWEDISPIETATGYGNGQGLFLDANIGFLITEEKFYSTVDGGVNWSTVDLPNAVMSIDFMDANNGVIGTWDGTFNYFGGMLATNDGGITWNNTELDLTQSVIGEVIRIDANTAYAAPVKWGASQQFQFYKTSDNGLNWSEILVPVTQDEASLVDFDFRDEMNGVIALSSQSAIYTYSTNDGGATWELQDALPDFELSDLELTPNSGYISGYGGLIYRLDEVTSVNNEINASVNVYPNPVGAGNEIRWELTESFTSLAIFNLSGKLVFQTNLTRNSANIPNLSPGIYYVQLQSQSQIKVQKLLVN